MVWCMGDKREEWADAGYITGAILRQPLPGRPNWATGQRLSRRQSGIRETGPVVPRKPAARSISTGAAVAERGHRVQPNRAVPHLLSRIFAGCTAVAGSARGAKNEEIGSLAAPISKGVSLYCNANFDNYFSAFWRSIPLLNSFLEFFKFFTRTYFNEHGFFGFNDSCDDPSILILKVER